MHTTTHELAAVFETAALQAERDSLPGKARELYNIADDLRHEETMGVTDLTIIDSNDAPRDWALLILCVSTLACVVMFCLGVAVGAR